MKRKHEVIGGKGRAQRRSTRFDARLAAAAWRCRAAPSAALIVTALAAVASAPAPGVAAEPPSAAQAAAPSPVAGPRERSGAAAEVVVVEDGARWESAYGERFFQVVGTVTNRSGRPVGAVQVRTELLDGENEVVATFDAWNGRAEALGDLAGDAATRELAALAPDPIAPGGSDRFRATFLEDETPGFESHRIRVVNVLPAP